MSGWDPGSLFEVVYGLFTITLGGLFLVEHILAARAYDRKLRDSNGGMDLRPRTTGLLWAGLIFITIGATNLLFPTAHPHRWPMMVAFGGLLLAVGVVWPFVEAVRRRRQNAELAGRGAASEHDTDVLRALPVGLPDTTARPRQLAYTLICLLFGGAMLTLGLMAARQ